MAQDATRHFVVTNRSTARRRRGGRLVEYVDDRAHRALPVFRVARFAPFARPPGRAADDDAFTARVSLVPDAFVESYEGLDPGDDPDRHPGTRCLFLELYQRMSRAPEGKGDALFFIHGFNTDWPASLRLLQRLHELYVTPASSPVSVIVMFSWPSYGSLLRYPSDQRTARESGQLLGRLMAKLAQFHRDFFEPRPGGAPPHCGRQIHLAAHSMGNQVLEALFEAIGRAEDARGPFLGEALLLSADVDWTALDPGRPLHGLPDVCDRVHVYNHDSDDALRISETFKNREKRLGRHGPRDLRRLPPRTLVVDASDLRLPAGRPPRDAFAPTAEAIVAARTSSTRERLFDHWGYLYRPEVIADIRAVLRCEPSAKIRGRERKDERLFRLVPRRRRSS
ncbi:MAG: hypothetical protein Kow0062_26470 [Acidobacteriota bacterium]